ncbi:amino acid adenylation domain-containing protein [Lentzea sp. NEAU-D7]|uniref:non-ribosomal peptide synthetase n=1 Tax=Lentzea sp. NEAU-D7 TaxID=2994667 RepID=UPI00224AFFCD|nr:amino acid adenylation domain-containing protein [Lentzea sp. NEAU-D7]MCX2950140.1 amino acid adenylation domain-containing protein [Lentzea sp. NEAU-D7]
MTSLVELVGRGVQLTPAGDRLRLRAAPGILDPAGQDAVKEHKSELLDVLGGRSACRLTGVQDRIWFLTKLDPTGVAYTFTVTYRIEGPVDAAALASALETVWRRHPGLRATFEEIGGVPVQFIEPESTPVLRTADLPGATREEVDRALRDALIAPFDLSRGPLMRSMLVRTGEREHVWGLTLHHLVADGWTTGLVVREIAEILCGEDDPAAVVGLDYTDYAEWERTHAASPAAAANLDHWVGALSGSTPLELPLDHPRPARRGHAGARVDFVLRPELVAGLTEFGQEEAATRFATLLAVYLVLLWHSTERDDISIGTPFANRLEPAFERTAGCFVSTLVLRVGLSPELSFRELVRRTAAVCADAWDHQNYSYETLVGEVAGSRDLSRSPLFQAFFAFQDAFHPLRLPGATAELRPFDTGSVQFDLELHFHPGVDERGLLGSFYYDTALFERSTVEAMARRWQHLAASLLGSPDLPIGDVSLMTELERRNLRRRNSTASDHARDTTVDRLVARWADAAAERVAVRCDGRELSYAELDRAVSALACRIDAAGGRGRRIGIFLDRGPEMVVAVLAAVRAGAVFVPLATDLPAERMAWIVEDTGMLLAITSSDVAASLPEQVEPLPVDESPDTKPGGLLEPPASGSPAYVLHTSGSTGRPKGVEVRHDNLLNLLHAMAVKPGIRQDDVFLAVTSLSFDISLLELLLPLVTGATVVVATLQEATDPARLARLLDTSGATVMQATPSTWRMLFDSGWKGLSRLTALCGGEALSRDLADRLLGGCKEVWNLYGPTETTIWSARWKVDATDPVRIGEPIENTRFYVVNGRGLLVPQGVPGELCIAGEGVANGYLNRPEETGQRFADLAEVPERVYRTGDLVRELADGTLTFLGRTDQQLKVRGHRVEAAEVEHALRRHPAVADAVVTLTADGVLVAHVAAPDGHTAIPEELRELLIPVLPAYMVPQRFVVHTTLPMTPNGKVDRKALSSIVPEPAPSGTPCAPPVGETEAVVAQIYEDLLGRTGVGRHDGFFDLGGHSLLATRALFRVEERFGVRVELQTLFANPAVAALAARIDDGLTRGAQDDLAISAALDRLESMSDEEVARLLDGPH